MAEPTQLVREAVYNRDGRQCVSCGNRTLQFQHRQAVGMGGSKIRPELEQGLTTCPLCNPGYEAHMQTRALLYGWKAPRWVLAHAVPVFYPHAASGMLPGWYRLEDDQRYGLEDDQAARMMQTVYGDLYLKWTEELV